MTARGSKLSKAGEPAADFIIQGPADHGIDNIVNLFGIESPGLTASLAIAEEVCNRLAMRMRQPASCCREG